MITVDLAADLAQEIRGMDIPLVYKTDAINAIQTIRLERGKDDPIQHRINLAAGTLERLAPGMLDRIFEADPDLGKLITVGGKA